MRPCTLHRLVISFTGWWAERCKRMVRGGSGKMVGTKTYYSTMDAFHLTPSLYPCFSVDIEQGRREHCERKVKLIPCNIRKLQSFFQKGHRNDE